MRTVPAIPPPTPVGVTKHGLRYPAPPLKLSSRAAEVLADLRADDVPVPPAAIRDVHDRTTWLPASVGLRRVAPSRVLVDDIDTVVADILAAAPAVIGDGTGLGADLLGLELSKVGAILAPIAEDAPDTSWGTHAEQLDGAL